MPGETVAMIRIDMTQQNSNHASKRCRHQGRAICEVAGRRFEAQGPAPIYKLATLLWLHGHGGAEFEVWDDLSPFGKSGGLAMTGRVRNWARLVKGKPSFDRQAKPSLEFAPDELDMIARAARLVSDVARTDSPAPGNARTAATRPPDGPNYPQDRDGPPTTISGARAPEAA